MRLFRISKGKSLAAADQGLSSASNMLLAVAVAHTVSASDYGVYAIAASIYWLSLGTQRAGLGEPLLIRWRDFEGEDPTAAARVMGLSLALGAVIGICLLPFYFSPLLRPLATLGLVMPALLLQDAVRYGFFGHSNIAAALRADAIWLAAEVGGGGALLGAGTPTVSLWIVCWGVGAAVSAVFSMRWLGARPVLTKTFAWAARSRRMSMQMVSDFVVASGGQQAMIFALPVVSSLTVLAGLKSAQVAAGPLQILMTSSGIVVIPAIAGAFSDGEPGRAVERGRNASALIFAVGCVYATGLALVPSGWGTAVFGDAWLQAEGIAGLVGFQYALFGAVYGAQILMRASRQTGRSLVVRILLLPLNVGGPLVGAALGGASGLGISLVLCAAFSLLVWWWVALTAIDRPTRADPRQRGLADGPRPHEG